MPFLLSSNPDPSDISDAINYLLANFGPNLSADPVNGQITGPQGIVIGYLYRYMAIKYADSVDGSVNFSNVPTNRQYYGLSNSDSTTESTNPADYIWYKAAGGFGTTKQLYYQTNGGRSIQFVVATTSPGVGWGVDAGVPIDLDIITAVTLTAATIVTIYQWTSSSTAPTRPSTTSTYTWATATFTPPTGWTKEITSDTTPGHYLWAIAIPLVQNSTTTTSVLDWTNTSYQIVCIGYNGTNGVTGANGLNFLTAYKAQAQNVATPTFTTPTSGSTAPTGWSLTAPSVSVGQVLWYIQGRYNSSSSTIDGVAANTTAWTGPVAASIFQDIRSDNWNGSNPPVAGTPSTYGTAGYYIQQATGNMFLNSIYARGIAQFDGANTGTGGVTAAILANASLGQNSGVEGYTNQTFITSGALRAFNQATGGGNALYAYHSGTGNAILAQSASGTGVLGTGVTGVQGSGTTGVSGSGSSGGYGVSGNNTSGATAIYANGYYGTNNNTLVTNLYADYAKTMVGTGGANQLRFVSGTSTGAAAASFSGVKPGSASTNVWMTIQIDATTLYIPVWT